MKTLGERVDALEEKMLILEHRKIVKGSYEVESKKEAEESVEQKKK